MLYTGIHNLHPVSFIIATKQKSKNNSISLGRHVVVLQSTEVTNIKTPYTLLIPVFINFHHSGSSGATLSSTAVIRAVTNLVLLRVGD
jgi:hypothetical protein